MPRRGKAPESPKPDKDQSSAKQVKAAAEILGKAIDDHGWISITTLAEIAAENSISHELSHQAIRLLDRRGNITAKKGPAGESGWESLLGASKQRKRYGGLSDAIQLRMVFVTPPLGQKSTDGEHFSLPVDDQGQVIFTPAGFAAMLHKAYRLSGLAEDEGLSEASVDRIAVQFLGIKEAGRTTVTRRPINRQGQAVGECLHEALEPGSTADWSVRFPVTHYTSEQADALLDAAQHVGYSMAGSGRRGGHHGLFRWERVAQ